MFYFSGFKPLIESTNHIKSFLKSKLSFYEELQDAKNIVKEITKVANFQVNLEKTFGADYKDSFVFHAFLLKRSMDLMICENSGVGKKENFKAGRIFYITGVQTKDEFFSKHDFFQHLAQLKITSKQNIVNTLKNLALLQTSSYKHEKPELLMFSFFEFLTSSIGTNILTKEIVYKIHRFFEVNNLKIMYSEPGKHRTLLGTISFVELYEAIESGNLKPLTFNKNT